jgi:hypothetical protein
VIGELGLLVGAFLLATLVATAIGAANTGTALTFGQLAVAAVGVWIIVRKA